MKSKAFYYLLLEKAAIIVPFYYLLLEKAAIIVLFALEKRKLWQRQMCLVRPLQLFKDDPLFKQRASGAEEKNKREKVSRNGVTDSPSRSRVLS